jgi:HEAT repeat protein
MGNMMLETGHEPVQYGGITVNRRVNLFLMCLAGIIFAASCGKSEEEQADERIGKLIAQLKHKHADLRLDAAKRLGLIGDPRAIEPLIETLDDRVFEVHVQASVSLVRITGQELHEHGTTRTKKFWLNWWESNKYRYDEDLHVQNIIHEKRGRQEFPRPERAPGFYGGHPPKAPVAEKPQNMDTRTKAKQVVERLRKEKSEEQQKEKEVEERRLQEALAKLDHKDAEVRRKAIEALFPFAERADNRILQPMFKVLKNDKDNIVKSHVTSCLEILIKKKKSVGSAIILKTLSELLMHTEPRVRASAAKLLGTLGDKATYDLLSTLLRQEKEHEVRIRALGALSEMGGRKALEILDTFYRNSDKNERTYILQLYRGGGKDGRSYLCKGLYDEEESVRTYAAGLIGYSRDMFYFEPLIEAWKRHEQRMKRENIRSNTITPAIQQALMRITGRNPGWQDISWWEQWWDKNQHKYPKQ